MLYLLSHVLSAGLLSESENKESLFPFVLLPLALIGEQFSLTCQSLQRLASQTELLADQSEGEKNKGKKRFFVLAFTQQTCTQNMTQKIEHFVVLSIVTS